MKTNIVLISLNDNLNKEISKKISTDFDLYLADISDLLEYNFYNEKEITEACGIDYLNSLKYKTIKNVATYENTLITIPFSLFLDSNNAELFKKYGTIVYLKFPKDIIENQIQYLKEEDKLQAKILLDAFEEHNKLCEEYCDVTIELNKTDIDFCSKKISKVLDKYYL